MSKTIQATVKVMLSYDYCHFEVSKTIVNEITQDSVFTAPGITQQEIDDARKDCQRLADKAVGQYKTAKIEANRSTINSSERRQLEQDVATIRSIPESNRTPLEKAKVKALEDWGQDWRYNYMDDGEYEIH